MSCGAAVRRCTHGAVAAGAGPQQPPSRGLSRLVEESRAAADAGLGEGELDAGGGLVVTGEGGGDGADLLVAGQGQERRGAAVGLHPDDVDALLVVGELGGAVRVDGAAGVDVGVDERGQRDRGLEAVVEAQSQLGQDRVVGAEPGEADDLVERRRCGARPR